MKISTFPGKWLKSFSVKTSNLMNVSRLKNPKTGLEKTENVQSQMRGNVGGRMCWNSIVETKMIGFLCFTDNDTICVAY